MTNLPDLPDLIVYRIIKITRNSTDKATKLKEYLPFLAICGRWRQVGLPMFYGTLTLASARTITCAIELYTNKAYKKLVKRVVIGSSRYYDSYGGVACSLAQYISRLSGSFEDKLVSSFAKVMSRIVKSLEVFATEFPNINSLVFDIDDGKSLAVQLATSLVGKYEHQLVSLVYECPKIMDIDYFPVQITRLHCNLHGKPASELPKINPIMLKDLNIKNPPKDFSQLFTYKPGSEGIVFPNLRNLLLSCNKKYSEEEVESPELLLHFPKLQYLKIEATKRPTAFEFYPETMPKHLESLVIVSKKAAIFDLGYLPVDSIGHICIQADKLFDGDNENEGDEENDFIRVTDYLLDGANITHTTSEITVECPKEHFSESVLVKWTNITKLELIDPRASHCIFWILRVPVLKELCITYKERSLEGLWLHNFQEIYPEMSESMVEYLCIDSRPSDNASEYVGDLSIRLMRSLKNLKQVCISKKEATVSCLAFQMDRHKYPHFDNIELRYF